MYPQRFQITSGEEFDRGSWKKPLSPHPSSVGRPSAAAANVTRLDSCHNQHWPVKHKNNIRRHICSDRGQRKTTIYKCAKCDVGLCVVPCFADYHTNQICKAVLLQQACVCSLCGGWRTTQGARNLCSSQNYVSNKIFTLHFINCMQ